MTSQVPTAKQGTTVRSVEDADRLMALIRGVGSSCA